MSNITWGLQRDITPRLGSPSGTGGEPAALFS